MIDADDADAIDAWRAQQYPRPALTVDLVVFTVLDADLKVLLIRRGEAPFRHAWALPGGFVRVGDGLADEGEDLDAAAQRELVEETGLPHGAVYLEQLYTFGRAGRDPRGRVVTVAYYALVRPDLAPLVTAGTDAEHAEWCSVAHVDRAALAFDHADILALAVDRIRGKLDYAPIAFDLVPATFSVSELRAVHEAIKGEADDPSNFRRRFRRMVEDGLIEQAPGKRITGRRPAAVYRFVRR